MVFDQLREWLTLVEDRSTDDQDGLSVYWRDEQTGLHWHQVFLVRGFNQVEELIPIDNIPTPSDGLPPLPER